MKRIQVRVPISRHSKVFLKCVASADPYKAIRTITHKQPLLIFWVSPEGAVVDANPAHRISPPNGDPSIFGSKTHKGYLRGRAAYLGNVVYIVIYGTEDRKLTNQQLALLRRSAPRLIDEISKRVVNPEEAYSSIFIDETGEDLVV
jgi:hypothetical protein